MNARRKFSLFILAMMLTAACPVYAESPEALLQQGILAQTGERDFDKAIQSYKQAITLAGASNPELAARVELQLGLCYEAQGKDIEAVAAYHAVLNLQLGKTTDMTEAAQTHLQRLESRLSALEDEKRATTRKAAEVHPRSPWQASIQLGRLSEKITSFNNNTYRFNHVVVWGDLGYRPGRYFRMGFEGGDIIPAGSVSNTQGQNTLGYLENTTLDTHSSGIYGGLFGQMEKDISPRIASYMRLGMGTLYQNIHVKGTTHVYNPQTGDFLGTVEYGDYLNISVSLALAFTFGTDWKLRQNLRIGLGVRDVMRLRVDSHYEVPEFNTVTRLLAYHYLTPFVRMAVDF